MKETLFALRAELLDIGERVKTLVDHPSLPGELASRGEMQANIMLSYRHLEDARMRLGKVIQAREGGVSVYDKGSPAAGAVA